MPISTISPDFYLSSASVAASRTRLSPPAQPFHPSLPSRMPHHFSHRAKALSPYSTPLLSSCLCVASPAPDHQTCFTIATTSVSSECAPETFVSDTCEQPSRIAYEARLFIHIIFLRCQK